VTEPFHIGLVVHPTRDVRRPLDDLLAWAAEHGAEVTQIPYGDHLLLPEGTAESCTLVVAIGGDGTTLAAIHHAAEVGKPVLGIACGSLGALTAVGVGAIR
jgi:NAD+ kinase